MIRPGSKLVLPPKINRAREHIESAQRIVEQIRASQPYSPLPEPTDKSGRGAYRLRITRPVPVAVSTTIGDAIHNTGAAGKPGVRTPPAQPCCALGCPSGTSANLPDLPVLASFDAFFKGAKTSLYDDRARAAFRVVQAFVNPEHAHLLHVGLDRSFREDFRWALLHRMDALRYLDKHRRLTLMGHGGRTCSTRPPTAPRAGQPYSATAPSPTDRSWSTSKAPTTAMAPNSSMSPSSS